MKTIIKLLAILALTLRTLAGTAPADPPIKETKMVRSSKKLYVHMKSLLLSAIVAGFAAAVLVIVAHAQDSYPTVVCSPGYVWRDAFDGDLICVTPQRYAQVQEENRRASEHIDPNAVVYGFTNSDDCLRGYTWRLAGPHDKVDLNHQVDRVCVTIKAYDQADEESDHPDDHRDYRYNYPGWGTSFLAAIVLTCVSIGILAVAGWQPKTSAISRAGQAPAIM